MSACLSLYRVREEVNYNGHWLDKYTEADLREGKCEEWHKMDAMSPEEIEVYQKELEANCFSDGKLHDKLIFSTTIIEKGKYKKPRAIRRQNKKISRHIKIKTYTYQSKGWSEKYIIADEIAYRQGWNLRSKFFKKEYTANTCSTKKEMLDFLRNNLVFNGDKGKQSLEMVEYFERKWDEYKDCGDKLMFRCVW